MPSDVDEIDYTPPDNLMEAATFELLEDQLKRWSLNIGFALHRTAHKRGVSCYLDCRFSYRATQPRSDDGASRRLNSTYNCCPYRIYLRAEVDKWVAEMRNCCHNHPMAADPHTHSGLRCISPEAKSAFRLLADLPPKQAAQTLEKTLNLLL
ncbi:hypothetical protein GEMRC1_005384 [Eukaryota sp. GEM-RC1]